MISAIVLLTGWSKFARDSDWHTFSWIQAGFQKKKQGIIAENHQAAENILMLCGQHLLNSVKPIFGLYKIRPSEPPPPPRGRFPQHLNI